MYVVLPYFMYYDMWGGSQYSYVHLTVQDWEAKTILYGSSQVFRVSIINHRRNQRLVYQAGYLQQEQSI